MFISAVLCGGPPLRLDERVVSSAGRAINEDTIKFGFVQSPWSSGWLLLGVGARETQAWVPPGVSIGVLEPDLVGLWSTARWDGRECVWGRVPACNASCSVGEVTTAVPADFHRWVFQSTGEQLLLLRSLFRRSHAGTCQREWAGELLYRLWVELHVADGTTPAIRRNL